MKLEFLTGLAGLAFTVSSFATVLSGPGGSGVAVGSSSLIDSLDYSDAFTTGLGGVGTYRVGADVYPWTAPDAGSEELPNNYGNPSRSWPIAFSMNQDTPSAGFSPTELSPYPGNSGAGSSSGLTQAGGDDWAIGISYGLRSNFVVQVDAVIPTDRFTLMFGPGADAGSGGLFGANTLSVFVRPTGVWLYNPVAGEIPTDLAAGPSSGIWANIAAKVNLDANTIEVFANESSLGIIDVGALMPGYEWDASKVGYGLRSFVGDRAWSDNFQIGASLPDRGVAVGASTIIGTLDYSDSFTTGLPVEGGYRTSVSVYPFMTIGDERVESSYGNPLQYWPFSFSMEQIKSSTILSPYPGDTAAGAATGVTQSGSSDWAIGIPYGLRSNFVMQLDAVMPTDRMTFIFGPGAADGEAGIFTAGTLSVFLRSSNQVNNVVLYLADTFTEVPTGLISPLPATQNGRWHNFAAKVNLVANTIELYVDQVSIGVVNVGTLAPGYAWDASEIGFGLRSPGGDRAWSDNFQVGAPAAELGTLSISNSGNTITVTRIGSGILYSSENLSAPWIAVPGNPNPYVFTRTLDKLFFRLGSE